MQKPSKPELTIAGECIAARMRILNRVVTGIYDDALRPHGVRVSQMNILVVVAARGPIRQADVARQLQLEKSTLSRDLDRMLARGWVRANTGSGRSPKLEATDAGRQLLRTILPKWRAAQVEATRLLSPAVVAGVAGAVDGLWAAQARD
jgi:DNA-binding MarR family transcriptional regulator